MEGRQDALGHRDRRAASREVLNLYLDTSAFVKLLVAEPGSDSVGDFVEAADRIHTCRLTYVEARAALARARRAARLSNRELAAARATLERHWDGLVISEVDETLVSRAGSAAEDFSLRAYDAVQLVSALTLEDRDLLFLSWDRELREAAYRAGLGIAS